MDRVKQVANGLMNPEVFTPSDDAANAWTALLKRYNGERIPDKIGEQQEIYKQNVIWINKVKSEGYDILDIGGGTTSTFYNMDRQVVYGKGAKKP